MESISSLVKKHCHCGVNIISGLLLIIHSVLSTLQAVMIPQPANIACCAVLILITIFCWMYIFGCKAGCTLLRIPLIIADVLSFLAALLSFSLGVVFIAHSDAEEYIDQILTKYGIEKLEFTPYVLGIALIVIGLVFFVCSFCLLAGVRYFGSIKKCLNGEIKRSGAKIFGVSCIILFVFVAMIGVFNTAAMLMDLSFYSMITTMPNNIVYINFWLMTLLLLFVGISANSFSSKTYAFKVFENQMMKVESNADGTVYVPINEENEKTFDSKADEAPVKLPTSFDNMPVKASDDTAANEKHKPYIKEGQVEVPESNKKSKEPLASTGESDII